MTELDVITLEEAKDYLVVDFPDHDKIIKDAIKTAVAWVEKYTDYALYEREIVVESKNKGVEIFTYPFSVVSVMDGLSVAEYTKTKYTLSTVLYTSYDDLSINLKIGYSNRDDIPAPLLSACYKLITYLYNNRDAYGAEIPSDIQGLINQYRRDVGI